MANTRSTQTRKQAKAETARERAAANRAARQQAERRRRLTIALSGVVSVLVVIGLLVGVKLATGGSSAATAGPSGQSPSPAAASVVDAVTGISQDTLNTVGVGTATTAPGALTGNPPALTQNGKPEVLYVGAEYCPFCAGERWALVQALSRFGTFSGLKSTTSSSTDVHPNTPTFSFLGSTYSSQYLAFTPVETQDRQGKALQTLTDAQKKLQNQYGSGSIPFIDYGNQFASSGASFDISVLDGKSEQQIATALQDPTSPIAKAVDGTANVITARLCQLTNGQPTNVCTSAAVKAVQSKLSGK